ISSRPARIRRESSPPRICDRSPASVPPLAEAFCRNYASLLPALFSRRRLVRSLPGPRRKPLPPSSEMLRAASCAAVDSPSLLYLQNFLQRVLLLLIHRQQ